MHVAAGMGSSIAYMEWEPASCLWKERKIYQYADKKLLKVHRIAALDTTAGTFTVATTVTSAMLSPSNPADIEVSMPLPLATLHAAVIVTANASSVAVQEVDDDSDSGSQCAPSASNSTSSSEPLLPAPQFVTTLLQFVTTFQKLFTSADGMFCSVLYGADRLELDIRSPHAGHLQFVTDMDHRPVVPLGTAEALSTSSYISSSPLPFRTVWEAPTYDPDMPGLTSDSSASSVTSASTASSASLAVGTQTPTRRAWMARPSLSPWDTLRRFIVLMCLLVIERLAPGVLAVQDGTATTLETCAASPLAGWQILLIMLIMQGLAVMAACLMLMLAYKLGGFCAYWALRGAHTLQGWRQGRPHLCQSRPRPYQPPRRFKEYPPHTAKRRPVYMREGRVQVKDKGFVDAKRSTLTMHDAYVTADFCTLEVQNGNLNLQHSTADIRYPSRVDANHSTINTRGGIIYAAGCTIMSAPEEGNEYIFVPNQPGSRPATNKAAKPATPARGRNPFLTMWLWLLALFAVGLPTTTASTFVPLMLGSSASTSSPPAGPATSTERVYLAMIALLMGWMLHLTCIKISTFMRLIRMRMCAGKPTHTPYTPVSDPWVWPTRVTKPIQGKRAREARDKAASLQHSMSNKAATPSTYNSPAMHTPIPTAGSCASDPAGETQGGGDSAGDSSEEQDSSSTKPLSLVSRFFKFLVALVTTATSRRQWSMPRARQGKRLAIREFAKKRSSTVLTCKHTAWTRQRLVALLLLTTCMVGGAACTGIASTTIVPPEAMQGTAAMLALGGYVMAHKASFSTFANSGISCIHPDGEGSLVPSERYTKDPDHGWVWGNAKGMNPEQQERLQSTVLEHKSAFAFTMAEITGYTGDLGPFRIDLDTTNPIYQSPRRRSEAEREVAKEKTEELIAPGIVVPCTTGAQYACNSVIAAKKDADTGMWTDKRMAQDYRRINDHTPPDKYGLHRPEDIFQRVGKAKFFTKLDMRQGFLQIPILPEHQSRTAYWLDNQLMMYTRMPYGLKNAPAWFQRIMDFEISKAGLDHCAVAFIDDLLIYSDTAEDHIKQVASVLEMLESCGLKAHNSKSLIGCDAVEYLGHNISFYGMHPHEAKVAAIRELKAPSNVSELRALLGFVNYYRCYVPNFSAMACPLNMLLRKDVPWLWGPDQQIALEAMKQALTTEGLALRRIDYSKPLILHTDWSALGMGAVLGQKDDDGNEYMCACISRSLNKHERNYSSYKGEMLGAVWAVKTFRHHLHGNRFLLITDHSPLTYLMSNPNLTGQYARWALALQEFDFQVEHRPGIKHQNADVLSRFPRASTDDYTGARLDHDPAPIEAESTIRVATFTRTRARLDFQLMQAYMSNALHGGSWIDDHCPTPSGLLAGHNGVITDPLDAPPEPDESILSKRQERLNLRANSWVHQAKGRMKAAKPAPTIPLQVERDASGHVTACTSLNTTILPNTAMNDMLNNGVFLYEPFGGLCAGLEMCLRNGIKVRRYAYSDSSSTARKVAMHRLLSLSAAYPTLLPPEAFQDALLILPHDVTTVTHQHLQKLALLHPYQWMVVAGWPCQDLSAAGPGTGLNGSRSRTFFDLLRILGTLQTLMPDKPPAYILENAAMQLHKDPFIHQQEFGRVCAAIGQPVLLDAAQFGAYAHRLRNFWLNIGCTIETGAVYHGIQRDPSRSVQDILEPYHEPKIAKSNNPRPYCRCNVVGEPLRVLPTLVTFQHSHAFRDDGPGMLFNKINGIYEEPNAEERERALGYETGSTAAPGLTATDRHVITGNAMDATCMESLLAISLAIHRHKYGIQSAPFVAAAAMVSYAPKGIALGLAALSTAVVNTTTPGDQSMLAELAELQDTHAQPSDSPDIWEDATTMHYLCTHEHEPGLTANEQRRITKRARQYSYQSGKLYRLMADGTKREVPKQADRLALVKSMHEDTGHFGERRTTALLQTSYWWTGMRRDAKAVVKHCKVCDRIKASFNHSQPQLNPLPIVGLFYRWGVDLAGPFEETPRGHKYVMVCIEHFSKYAIFVPLKDKTADCTTFAFMHNVLGRFGACAELVSDQGGEWKAAFTELLAQSLIDHRFTSPNHPQANGLSERAVQTCKRALRKLAEDSGTRDSWDVHLPYVMLGYNCSTQESTKMSPYQLMHSISPIVPPAIKERFDSPLDLDGDEAVEAAAESVRIRAAALQRNLAIAGENLMAAQHRDTLRYATIRGGGYHPRLRRFEVDDYVYHRNTTHAKNLELKARPEILRVKEVRPSGVLVLQGRCGGTITVHAIHCAPCHLLISTHDINIHLGRPSATHSCEVCKYTDDEHVMLLCDSCNSGWHTFCLTPQLEAVPPGRWICPACSTAGVTPGTVAKAMAEAEVLQAKQGPVDLPASASISVPPAMLPFHNRAIMQPFVDPSGKSRLYRGTTEYAGKQGNSHYFNIRYEDGDIETVTYSKIKCMLDDSEAAPSVPGRTAMKRSPVQASEVEKAVTFQTPSTSNPAANIRQSANSAAAAQQLSGTAMPSTRLRSRTAAVAHRYNREDDYDCDLESAVRYTGYVPLRGPPNNDRSTWSLTDKEGLSKIISYHMRGEYEGEDLGSLAAAIKLGPPAHAVGFNLLDADRFVSPLLRAFNLSNSVDIYDPMPGQGGIEHFFKRQGYPTRRSDLPTSQHSPLLAQHYADIMRAGFTMDTIVCRPWAATLDIFLPLVAQLVRTVACVYAPSSYVLEAPPHRLGWLRRMQGFGCLYIMIGVPDLGGGNSAMWICVNKREQSHHMVKSSGRQARMEIA